MINTPFIFVYGTLQSGYWIKESLVLKRIAKFAGKGTTSGILYTTGAYPALNYHYHKRGRVTGELFLLKSTEKCLKYLDKYEHAYTGEREYLRDIVPVKSANGKIVMANAYIYNGTTSHLKKIKSGTYRPKKRNKFCTTVQP